MTLLLVTVVIHAVPIEPAICFLPSSFLTAVGFSLDGWKCCIYGIGLVSGCRLQPFAHAVDRFRKMTTRYLRRM